jgi:superfamily II DNA helicase RecQ
VFKKKFALKCNLYRYTEDLRATLSKFFGHADFREGQLEVIAAAVEAGLDP